MKTEISFSKNKINYLDIVYKFVSEIQEVFHLY